MLFRLLASAFCLAYSLTWADESQTIYGEVAKIEQFPYVGRLDLTSRKNRQIVCTSALIGPRTALTAAHCVLDNETGTPLLVSMKTYVGFVTMGVNNYQESWDAGYQRSKVTRVFAHVRAVYDQHEPFVNWYDIGAVQMDVMRTTSTVTLIPMIPEELSPDKAITVIINNHIVCEIPGWVFIDTNKKPTIQEIQLSKMLHFTTVQLVSKKDCCEIYFHDADRYCTNAIEGYTGGRCHERKVLGLSTTVGNEGAPVVCPYQGKRFVVGIHVFGFQSMDTSTNGTFKVENPGLHIMESAMKSFIKNALDPAIFPPDRDRGHTNQAGVIVTVAVLVASTKFLELGS